MPVSPFEYVEEARIAMLYRGRLWRAVNEWKDHVERWETSNFDKIEVSEIG